MDTPRTQPPAADAESRPLTPEKVRRARERTAAIRDGLRRQGIDFSRLPDPVEELVKARDPLP